MFCIVICGLLICLFTDLLNIGTHVLIYWTLVQMYWFNKHRHTSTYLINIGTHVHIYWTSVHMYLFTEYRYTCTYLLNIGTHVLIYWISVHMYWFNKNRYKCTDLLNIGTHVLIQRRWHLPIKQIVTFTDDQTPVNYKKCAADSGLEWLSKTTKASVRISSLGADALRRDLPKLYPKSTQNSW